MVDAIERQFDSAGREIKSNRAWREEVEALRQQRPGILVSEVLRTIYVHPDVYEKWTSGMYRRGDWVPNA